MGHRWFMYYSDSKTYSCCIWTLIILYSLNGIFACIQLLKPLHSMYKKHIILILFLVILACLARIATLILVKNAHLYELYLLLCSHCILYQGILWTVSSIIFDISVSLHCKLTKLLQIKLKNYSKYIAFFMLILYACLMIFFSITTDNKSLLIVDFLFWGISLCVFSAVSYYLYFRVKPIYVYGLSNDAMKAIKFLFFMLFSFVILGFAVNDTLQAIAIDLKDDDLKSIMLFLQFFLCDITPYSVFLIVFSLKREKESQSFLLLEESDMVELDKKSSNLINESTNK
ncbi:hypothetical protein SteCoe_31898 [Stentor coeruleus]|uniref:Uncharacterized protein n=1 Tax=Stentor coeruleus TaxID=5963 RepID=A0A1R2B0A0_9CILI|nr:hypothetical protein SteCoe_31898 [Stentor coeruleus]